MSRFGRATADLSPQAMTLAWLAGLLEAEGSFLRPAPSAPNAPILVCRMTDADVIQRTADCFGVRPLAIDKGAYRTEYSARVKGAPAVRLMRELRPYMSARRRTAIDRALAAFTAPARRLDFDLSQQIRASRAEGATISSLARAHAVSRPTIRAVLRTEIYPVPAPRPWLRPLPPLGADRDRLHASIAELYWLAGWLEGEGSFLAPPPSDPRRPRIAGEARDRDVVDEVARLFGVSPTRRRDPRGIDKGWAVLYEALVRGGRAASFMRALAPVLGTRRRAQIERALEPRKSTPPLDSMQQQGGELASTWSVSSRCSESRTPGWPR